VKKNKKNLKSCFCKTKNKTTTIHFKVMKNSLICSILFLFIYAFTSAQTDSTKSNLTFSGYVEGYYIYDFNQPKDNNRPGFFYSHNRHNEFNLNLGFVKAAYDNGSVRANLALAAGSYMNANYAAEPGVFKNIFEANAGVKLSANKNLWVDAGIFASHIGFESAIGKDCWNMTRSLLADNSPYYETGVKISYTTGDGKWFLSGLVLNGWQQIRKSDSTNRLSFGTQITFKPTDKITLNSSTFIGNRPDGSSSEAANRNRIFHNFYGIFQLTDKLGLIAGFDYGWEQRQQGSATYDTWFAPVGIVRYAVSEKITLAARIENYTDKQGKVIGISGFNTMGYSLNLDVIPVKNAVWRLEGRLLNSQEEIFRGADGKATGNNVFAGTALAISF
jgi:Putative beta-barrel porin-2, OmpL-like. bbp2